MRAHMDRSGPRGSSLLICAFLAALSMEATGCRSEYATVSGGSFAMGSPTSELGRDGDEAQHSVTLTHSFEIMTAEVTQQKFEEALGYNPSFFPQSGSSPQRPVEQASWYDALAFANKLSDGKGLAHCTVLTSIVCADGTAGSEADYCKAGGGIASAEVAVGGGASVYACQGYRLPTEAEWELVARAGTAMAFPGGDITSTSCNPVEPNLDGFGWYCGNSGGKATHPVATKTANPWGVYDMNGNVAEWTWDGYVRDLAADGTDPEGASSAAYRVIRGGAAWYYGAARCRAAERAGHTPGFRDKHVGFRIVRTTGTATVVAKPVKVNPMAKGKVGPPVHRSLVQRTSLPFELTRPDVGTPLTPEEIAAFTRKVTGFWRDVGYFDWLLRVSHGMSDSSPMGMPDYKIFWQDVRAIKSNGVVTFEHNGFDDNLTIGMSKLFNNAASAYLVTGDPRLGRLVEQYSKGYVALFLGMAWDEQDPEEELLARAIFTQDHPYVEDGRQALVVYGPVKHEVIDWNAQTIPNPTNPFFGDIWVRNWRSKDDVPHIYRSVPMLKRVAAEGADASVREAAARAAELLERFSRDVVDTGWYIRSKDKQGNAYVPLNPNGGVADLASFVEYNGILPTAECNPKMASALIAYGASLGLDCGTGYGDLYEYFATQSHYYNYDIIRYFHAAAITNALTVGQNDVAQTLLGGLVTRVDEMMAGTTPHSDDPSWPADSASYLVVAASAGLPLTSAEARHVEDQFARAADHYAPWPNWDLWASSVPDGEVAWKPSRDDTPGPVVEIEEITYLLEYCDSPFRNLSGAVFVDCDIVRDPSRWGEAG